LAYGPRYRLPFRRRREGKTDYKARYRLVDADKLRFIVRVTNYHVITQIAKIGKMGDETLVSAHSKQLQNLGWLANTNNISAAYLTAILMWQKSPERGDHRGRP